MIKTEIIIVKSKQELFGLKALSLNQIAFVTTSNAFFYLIDWSRRNKVDAWKQINSGAVTQNITVSGGGGTGTIDDTLFVKYQAEYESDPLTAPNQTIYGNIHVVGNITATGEVAAFNDVALDNWWDNMPVASATVLGGIKVGTGLSITDGVLSATGAGTFDTTANFSLTGQWAFSLTPTVGGVLVSLAGHTHVGVYEPFITKTTGYLRYSGGAWSFLNESYSLTSHTHTFAAITNKPATYPPSAHTHDNVTMANFTIVQESGKIVFKYGSTVIASISTAGYIIALNEIASFGTP